MSQSSYLTDNSFCKGEDKCSASNQVLSNYFLFHNTQSLWKDGTKLIREFMQFTGGRIQENLQWFNKWLAEKF